MKIWGIVTTVLMVGFIGVSGWLYTQNKDLKDQKSSLETQLASSKTSLNTKVAAGTLATKKLNLITSIFAGINNQEDSLKIYDIVKEINDPTLTADWKAMQTSTPGDSTGTKFMNDLLASAIKDLK